MVEITRNRPNTQPGDDRPISPTSDLTILQAVRGARVEARDARKERDRRSRRNREAYLGLQDWSHKNPGQSTEFLPKSAIAIEQLSAFFKKAMVQFGDWFSVDLGEGASNFPLTEEDIREILKCYLDRLPSENDNRKMSFSTVMTDAIKTALLESLIIFKVHGHSVSERTFRVQPGSPIIDTETGAERTGRPFNTSPDKLVATDIRPWRLRIDLISPRDYYPDPTGRGLYEIHRTETDLYKIVEMAQAGVYDVSAVMQLIGTSQEKPEDEVLRERERNQLPITHPGFRKRVVIDEYWGTLLNLDGSVAHRNIVCAIANDSIVIRKPTPNPFWHQESPFVVGPLVRVPKSVWHKALYDDASPLNLALNEIFNLMLDGGMASVWGVRQVRKDALDNPAEIANGIPQGKTLSVNSTLPFNAKVIEQVTEGKVPPDAMAMFEAVNREFTSAALSSELKLGALPRKQVKATEIIEQSQSQAITLDGIVADVESDVMMNTLRKAWLTILQNADGLPIQDIVEAVGLRGAMVLARMSPAQRFATFASCCSFKVKGLSATLAKMRDFQKTMALLQSASVNPMLMLELQKRFSASKILDTLMKQLNINPKDLEKDELEQANQEQELRQMLALQQSMTGGGTPSAQNTGEPQLPSEINQQRAPATTATRNI